MNLQDLEIYCETSEQTAEVFAFYRALDYGNWGENAIDEYMTVYVTKYLINEYMYRTQIKTTCDWPGDYHRSSGDLERGRLWFKDWQELIIRDTPELRGLKVGLKLNII